MIGPLIDELLAGHDVDGSALEGAFSDALAGKLSDAQLAGLLIALRTRRPAANLLVGAVRALRAHQVPFPSVSRPRIDTCGTGGDASRTFNISTASALCVAAAGGCVAKHGNRSVSSKTGSADVLEALGVEIRHTPEDARIALEEHGFCFLFAPDFHPAMAKVAGVRRELGVRTLFNLLGPLLNPTGAEFQVIGVYDAETTESVAGALASLGSERALVVHCGGLDELGLHEATAGHEVADGGVRPFHFEPGSLGVEEASLEPLRVETAEESARAIESVLAGEAGPKSDIVALNAGAALWISGSSDSLEGGFELAREVLRSGRASSLLEVLREEARS